MEISRLHINYVDHETGSEKFDQVLIKHEAYETTDYLIELGHRAYSPNHQVLEVQVEKILSSDDKKILFTKDGWKSNN